MTTVKSAISHLKLEGNVGKLSLFDDVADEFMWVTQCFVRHIVGVACHPEGWGRQPLGIYAFHPKQKDLPPIHTQLSERWKRVAWQQACGIVRSWLSNGRHQDGSDEPCLITPFIQANHNVVVLAKAKQTGEFDYWLKVSTLQRGKPIYLPFKMHPYGARILREAVSSGGKVSTGVTLNKTSSGWYCQICVTANVKTNKQSKARRGHDIGMVNILQTSDNRQYGTIGKDIATAVEKQTERFKRLQKLNHCRKKKGMVPLPLTAGKNERRVRNIIGRALNVAIADLKASDPHVLNVLEDLSVNDMKMKSRAQNRKLRVSQMGYTARQLRRKLDQNGLPWVEVPAAYSSQECSHCGFVLRENRPDQATFRCLMCGHEENADLQASRVIAGRSGDDEIIGLKHQQVGNVLRERFMRRWNGACPLPPTNARPGKSPVGDWRPGVIIRLGRRGSPTGAPDRIPAAHSIHDMS